VIPVKPGLFQILVIAMIVLVLFGRGRISAMMGDFGKGIKSFRKGLDEDEAVAARIDGQRHEPHATPETAVDKTAV
jgi:sec-independent protein translocase protein TatA